MLIASQWMLAAGATAPEDTVIFHWVGRGSFMCLDWSSFQPPSGVAPDLQQAGFHAFHLSKLLGD